MIFKKMIDHFNNHIKTYKGIILFTPLIGIFSILYLFLSPADLNNINEDFRLIYWIATPIIILIFTVLVYKKDFDIWDRIICGLIFLVHIPGGIFPLVVWIGGSDDIGLGYIMFAYLIFAFIAYGIWCLISLIVLLTIHRDKNKKLLSIFKYNSIMFSFLIIYFIVVSIIQKNIYTILGFSIGLIIPLIWFLFEKKNLKTIRKNQSLRVFELILLIAMLFYIPKMIDGGYAAIYILLFTSIVFGIILFDIIVDLFICMVYRKTEKELQNNSNI